MTMPLPPETLADRLRCAPQLSRADVAEDRLNDLQRALAADAPLGPLLARPKVRALLAAMADHSAFLWRLVAADPDRCAALLVADPANQFDTILRALAATLEAPEITAAGAMAALRRARQAVALLVALADLGGVWDLDQVTAALTCFADSAVRGALDMALREAARTGRVRAGTAAATCGLVILALGKGGGRELNYSSDIDLVVVFDPAGTAPAEGQAVAPTYVRLTQAVARLLQEATGDGFVLRVDLRLRPDPASTPVAVALPSALSYYETLGQNWERAAFIKARVIAGDQALGAAFLDDLVPFVWRKYFDYAAIADIHAMKRQIHAVRGQASVAVAGHDVKLGRGGIREIEFFVQTQQLIFGGRRPNLRNPRTCATLALLAAEGWISAEARDELTVAYVFLRTIEHRLQMIADQQTQRLPSNEDDLARFAGFAGFGDVAQFSETLLGHLRRVQHHYARLFEDAPALAAESGSLVFTGTAPDAGTVETLARLGFKRPLDAVELVRGWHFGRRPAVQSARAREVLTELVPALLQAFTRTGDPDGALAAFDTILGRMSAAIELLSLLRAHAGLRDLFADILGSAPRLAGTVARRPHVLDALIDPAALGQAIEVLSERIEQDLAGIVEVEDWLDRMRDLAREEIFQAGVRSFLSLDDVTQSQFRLTEVADAMVRSAFARALDEIEAAHGRCPGGACVVVGMGRLGSREMTATSDLDLIVIYRAEGDSDGAKSLDPGRYYARLTQRLIGFLTAPTRRGTLYAVDLRLRPSGKQGPVAVRLSAFQSYQEREAQLWEHMALSRARVVAGDDDLTSRVQAVIAVVLCRPRSKSDVYREVLAMRALIRAEKGDGGLWDMKLAPGGLLDLEFLAQALLLAHADAHPELLLGHPAAILAACGRLKLMQPEEADALVDAQQLQSSLMHLARFLTDTALDPLSLGPGGTRRLCDVAGQPDLPHLVAELARTRDLVRAIAATHLARAEESAC